MEKFVIMNNIYIEDEFTIDEDYDKYLIIIFGLRHNIKYFEIFNIKQEAIIKYGKLFHYNSMFGKDSRGLNLISGITSKCKNGMITIDDKNDKSIFSAFNNNFGIMYLIGFNSDVNDVYIGFSNKTFNNIITISNFELDDTLIKYNKKIKLNKNDIIPLKK